MQGFNATEWTTPEQVWWKIGIIVLWLALVALAARIANRYRDQDPELARKVVHIGTGNAILLAWWMHLPAWVGITASVLFSSLSVLSYYTSLFAFLNRIERHSWGTFFYAVSIGVLIAGFWSRQLPEYAVLGVLVMTWGDGLAGVIGQRWGQHPYYVAGMQKSWEGSITMATVSAIVSLAILLPTVGNLWQTWGTALVVAVVATLLEAYSKLGIDNLTVPIASAVLAYALVSLVSVF
jgi:phytol kinase